MERDLFSTDHLDDRFSRQATPASMRAVKSAPAIRPRLVAWVAQKTQFSPRTLSAPKKVRLIVRPLGGGWGPAHDGGMQGQGGIFVGYCFVCWHRAVARAGVGKFSVRERKEEVKKKRKRSLEPFFPLSSLIAYARSEASLSPAVMRWRKTTESPVFDLHMTAFPR